MSLRKSIYVEPEDLWEWVERTAAEQDRSASWIVCRQLEAARESAASEAVPADHATPTSSPACATTRGRAPDVAARQRRLNEAKAKGGKR